MADSFDTKRRLKAGGVEYGIYDLSALAKAKPAVKKLPFSIKILLENLLRHEDGRVVTREEIEAVVAWDPLGEPGTEIAFHPARVLLQDFTGVPAVVDLAAMRDAIKEMGGDPQRINPLQPADLVIDHSVQVDVFGSPEAIRINSDKEFQRNQERYTFLRWGQQAFQSFRVVPPDTGIVHQVNLEYLGQVAFRGKDHLVYPDSLVGTDSHTTMINGLGVLGWGVGGIEAEAAMLGQPVSMLIPQVVGFKLTGALRAGATATDLVLTIVEMLRERGVVGKFVEFYGPGLAELALADRATIANMAPEYGATMGFFPVDRQTLEYLRSSARSPDQVELVEAFCKRQGLFYTVEAEEPVFTDTLELDMKDVVRSIAGPKRPQDRIPLAAAKSTATQLIQKTFEKNLDDTFAVEADGESFEMKHGSIVIAAITSCTNTSNPAVMLGAGLLAKKAVEKGLSRRPWVKSSLAPGSKVVTDYLNAAGVMPALEQLGFHVVGYGCTTCIGNSGPLPAHVLAAIDENDMLVASALSGNRNFEGRISPYTRMSFLASPPLIVAFALAGTAAIDFDNEPLGAGNDGKPVFLQDIWPSPAEVQEAIRTAVRTDFFAKQYDAIFEGTRAWRDISVTAGDFFDWQADSTYVRRPPFFEDLPAEPAPLEDIRGARVLAMLGDTVTTDHISPAGAIPPDGPAGRYLIEKGVDPKDFNSFGSRRGNHEVMMRGTFANIRLRNQLVPDREGGVTEYLPTGEQMSIYDAAMKYEADGTPLVVVAGAEYGTGSSRDWAAKGTRLLGVRAVIAKSFERIHRSNLIGMGVLPLQFPEGQDAQSLGLDGSETFEVSGIAEGLTPRKKLAVRADDKRFDVVARVDTPNEIDYVEHGGILVYVLRQLLGAERS
jgi:aconitate hydratase